MSLFGLPVFVDLPTLNLVLLGVLYFGAFFIKGLFGYGALPPIILFGAFLTAPHHAVLLGSVANAYTQLQFIPVSIREGDWRIAGRIIVFFFPAMAFGVWVFSIVDANALAILMSLVILLIVGGETLNLFARLQETARTRFRIALPVLSAATGLAMGMIGGGGLIVISVILKVMTDSARTFRGTLLALATAMIYWRIGFLALLGFITPSLLLEALLLLPLTSAGGYVGARMFGRLTDERFFKLVRILMLVAAATLLIRTIAEEF